MGRGGWDKERIRRDMRSGFKRSEGLVSLKRILEPQSLLFGITLIYFLFRLVVVMGQVGNAFIVDQRGFVWRAIAYPLLLLVSGILILIGRLATIIFAIAIAGSLIYLIGYRGLGGVSYAHDVGALTLTALRIWVDTTPINLILQSGLSVVICFVGTVQLSRLLIKKTLR